MCHSFHRVDNSQLLGHRLGIRWLRSLQTWNQFVWHWESLSDWNCHLQHNCTLHLSNDWRILPDWTETMRQSVVFLHHLHPLHPGIIKLIWFLSHLLNWSNLSSELPFVNSIRSELQILRHTSTRNLQFKYRILYLQIIKFKSLTFFYFSNDNIYHEPEYNNHYDTIKYIVDSIIFYCIYKWEDK